MYILMFSVIEDHKDFLLINKHPGVAFHKGTEGEGLTKIIRAELGIEELYTLHRLDKVTSGLVLFARNKRAVQELAAQFEKRLVEKYYIAISDRRPKKTQGLIKGDMTKSRRGTWKLGRTMKNPAVTQFFSFPLGEGLRLYVLKPHTGKTHQLRVALKSISAPVYGDPLYHQKEYLDNEPDRGYLHSYALRFHFRGNDYTFVCKPDTGGLFKTEMFEKGMKRCERPWELPWPALK